MTKEENEIFEYNWKIIMTEGIEKVFKFSDIDNIERGKETKDFFDLKTSMKIYEYIIILIYLLFINFI